MKVGSDKSALIAALLLYCAPGAAIEEYGYIYHYSIAAALGAIEERRNRRKKSHIRRRIRRIQMI